MKGDLCSYRNCGKIAIGYEYVGGGMHLNVCENHASFVLKKMKPGGLITGKNNKYHFRYEE